MRNERLKVPTPLIHPFLTPSETFILDFPEEGELSFEPPFMYDAAYYLGMEGIKPWEEPEKSIEALLKEWGTVKDEIRDLFANRAKESVIPVMRKGIALFMEFLHWANGRPVRLYPQIEYDLLEVSPVNLQERLEFILARPKLYHSSMQLSELMDELEKGYRKAMAIKKRK